MAADRSLARWIGLSLRRIVGISASSIEKGTAAAAVGSTTAGLGCGIFVATSVVASGWRSGTFVITGAGVAGDVPDPEATVSVLSPATGVWAGITAGTVVEAAVLDSGGVWGVLGGGVTVEVFVSAAPAPVDLAVLDCLKGLFIRGIAMRVLSPPQ
jgi:hypothetical protein